MLNRLKIITQYEYLRSVRKVSFWIATLFFPLLIIILGVISGGTSMRAEKAFTALPDNIKEIDIIDEYGFINENLIQPPLKKVTDKELGISLVKQGEIDALIFYPKDLTLTLRNELDLSSLKGQDTESGIAIYSRYRGILASSPYSALAGNLLTASAEAKITDSQVLTILNSTPVIQNTFFNEKGETVNSGFTQYLLPIGSLVIFFILIFSNGQSLLQSMADEKENRMIETMLSTIDAKTLIYGKIASRLLVAMTQIGLWILFIAATAIVVSKTGYIQIPIDLSGINLSFLPLNIYFLFAGLLMYAALMVGIGAVGSNYKDSQSISGIFTLLSILPIYFITIIVSDPNGVVARVFSYFPFTSSMVLLMRNSFGQMGLLESIIGIAATLLYSIFSFYLASKLFVIGSLSYNRRLSMKEITKIVRGH